MENSCVMYTPTFREKLGWKLFPANHPEDPTNFGRHKDCLRIDGWIELSFLDRLRVLFSGRLNWKSYTATQNVIGEHVTASVAYPAPPKFLTRKDS